MLVVFIALIFATYSFLGQRLFGARRDEYRIRFADAGGVVPGTKVLMAGVQVGLVSKIGLVSPTEAEARFSVDKDVVLPEGTKAVLPASLVGGLGDTRIDLVAPVKPTPPLPPGSILLGVKAGPLDSLLPNAPATVEELTKTIRASRAILEDRELFRNIKSLLASLDKTVGKAGNVAGRVDGLLAENQDQLNAALRATTGTLQNVEATSRELARYARSGKLQGNVDGLFAELRTTTAESRRLLRDFERLASDPSLTRTTANVAKITDSGTRIGVNGEAISANAADVSASAARIASTAEGIAKDGKEISARIIPLTDKLNAIAERATGLEDRLGNILDRVGGRKPGTPGSPGGGGLGSGLDLPKVGARLDLMRETDPGRTRADLYLDLSFRRQAVNFGLYDAFESNRLILQLAKPFEGGPLRGGRLRYGIFAGKPGVGVDYPLGANLGFRGDAWGLNDPRLDLRLRLGPSKGLYGWIGADRVFRDSAPTFGLGFSR